MSRRTRRPAGDRASAGAGALMPALLLLTRDATLVDLVERLAAAVGCAVEVSGLLPARSAYGAAPLVLVDPRLSGVVASALPRRSGVVLVGLEAADLVTWQRAVQVGAEQVVVLPEGQQVLVEMMADCVDPARECRTVAVVGGAGGAGSSVLAAAVAVRGALAGLGTLLADLDPMGGGADLLVGVEEVPGLRWPDLMEAHGRVSGGALRDTLPRVEGLAVLAMPRGTTEPTMWAGPSEPASLAVAAAARRGFDLLVLDLPRDVHASWLAPWLRLVDLGVVVVPPTARGAAAAERVAAAMGSWVDRVQVVVRTGPGGLPAEVVAHEVAAPMCGELRAEPGLAGALARGEPPGLRARGPLARLAEHVLAEVRPSVVAA